jgi:hypothetical protein
VLTDLWQLLRGDSTHGLVYWVVWTLLFAGLAVAFFVTGNEWLAVGWAVGAFAGLIGLGITISRRPPVAQDRDRDSSVGHSGG